MIRKEFRLSLESEPNPISNRYNDIFDLFNLLYSWNIF